MAEFCTLIFKVYIFLRSDSHSLFSFLFHSRSPFRMVFMCVVAVGTIRPLRVSHSAKVNIYGLPFIREMPKITGISGTDLVVKCPVAGYPIDKIFWERGM